MIKYLVIFAIVLDIYTLIDCAMTPQEKVRRFPKWAWLLIIILTGFIGDIAWFIAGRPRKPRRLPQGTDLGSPPGAARQ